MKILATLFFTAITGALLAQIPNPSFENWTSGNPDNWLSGNLLYPGSVTESSTAHAGSHAVQFNNVSGNGGGISTGTLKSEYIANAGNPVAINGWYILNSVGHDALEMLSFTKLANNNTNGGAGLDDSNATLVYKQFSACYSYTPGTADSIEIAFQLVNSSGTTHTGSYVILDDLSFGSCISTDVPEISKDVILEAAYPNPANNFCNIIYSIPGTSTVSVALYDISGRKVTDILNPINQTIGRYKIPVDVSTLSNGIYIYTITVDGLPYSQKLSVVK